MSRGREEGASLRCHHRPRRVVVTVPSPDNGDTNGWSRVRWTARWIFNWPGVLASMGDGMDRFEEISTVSTTTELLLSINWRNRDGFIFFLRNFLIFIFG